MKLLNNVWRVVLTLITVAFFTLGFEIWVKAQGVDWSFEAGASATAELKRK